MTGPVSPHLTYLILPALSQHTTIQELISNAASINSTAFPQATSSPSQASIVTSSSLSPETLYCILLLVGDTGEWIGSYLLLGCLCVCLCVCVSTAVLPAHTVVQLVRIVADVLSLTPVITASSSDDTEEEEEEEESMEVC